MAASAVTDAERARQWRHVGADRGTIDRHDDILLSSSWWYPVSVVDGVMRCNLAWRFDVEGDPSRATICHFIGSAAGVVKCDLTHRARPRHPFPPGSRRIRLGSTTPASRRRNAGNGVICGAGIRRCDVSRNGVPCLTLAWPLRIFLQSAQML